MLTFVSGGVLADWDCCPVHYSAEWPSPVSATLQNDGQSDSAEWVLQIATILQNGRTLPLAVLQNGILGKFFNHSTE